MKKMFYVLTNKRILLGHFRGYFSTSGSLCTVYGCAWGRLQADSINFNAGRRAPPYHYSYRAITHVRNTRLISRQRRNTRVSQKRIFASHRRFCIFVYHHDTRSPFFFTTESPFKRLDSDDALHRTNPCQIHRFHNTVFSPRPCSVHNVHNGNVVFSFSRNVLGTSKSVTFSNSRHAG